MLALKQQTLMFITFIFLADQGAKLICGTEKNVRLFIYFHFLVLAFDWLFEVYEINKMSNSNYPWRHVQLSEA